jgi:hypothetical protein
MTTTLRGKASSANTRPARRVSRAPRAAALATALLALGTAFACSSSKPTPTTSPCNENPWSCPSGQVCWPTTATTFGCVPAGTGTQGASCTLTINPAQAGCGEGLNCLEQPNAGIGVCTPYCDSSHPCPTSSLCEIANLVGDSGTGGDFNVCVPLEEEGGTEEAGSSEGGASEAGTAEAGTSEGGTSPEASTDASAGSSDGASAEASISDASSDAIVGE